MSEESLGAVARFTEILATDDIVASLADPVEAANLDADLAAEAGPDFECVMVGPQYDSGELTGRGPEGFRQIWGEWMTAFESFRIEIGEVIDAGDKVVTMVRQVGRTKTGGVEIEAPAAALWTVCDGRVTRVEFHADRSEALRRAGLDPQTSQA